MKGSKRQRQPGVWELRVYTGTDPVTKRPRQVSRTFRGTGKAADTELAKLIAEASAGRFDATDVTVAQLLDEYFEHLERKGHSPKTLHTYRCYADNTIRPAIGNKAVRKLTAWDLDALYRSMGKAGKQASTVRQHHAILSGALGQARKSGWCSVNVATMASPPTVRVKKIEPPTAEEVRALVRAADERNPTLSALIMLAALTGARRGELCALQWTDVDLTLGTVRISRSILDLPDRVEEKATKSHQERTLALGEAGTSLLLLHRQVVLARAAIGEHEVAPDGFVFSERLDGSCPYRPDRVTGFFSRVRNDLKLGHIHLHSCRHFMATQLASRGDVSARTLAGRLGHADASVSLKVYSHFFPPADLEAADHLGRALSAPLRP